MHFVQLLLFRYLNLIDVNTHILFRGTFCTPVSTCIHMLALPADCPSPDCTGHGMCANGTCLCFRGYRGDDCSIIDTTTMCKKECSNHGTYRKDLDICICDPNWTGPDCSEGNKHYSSSLAVKIRSTFYVYVCCLM